MGCKLAELGIRKWLLMYILGLAWANTPRAPAAPGWVEPVAICPSACAAAGWAVEGRASAGTIARSRGCRCWRPPGYRSRRSGAKIRSRRGRTSRRGAVASRWPRHRVPSVVATHVGTRPCIARPLALEHQFIGSQVQPAGRALALTVIPRSLWCWLHGFDALGWRYRRMIA